MFYRNDRAGSQCSESWMLFVIIFTGWHFLGQVEASCSCFTCTMPRIHCTPTRCPLVHIVNSCSPKHGLSWDQLLFLPSWWELPYSQYWLLAKAKHKQEGTTVSNSPFSNVHWLWCLGLGCHVHKNYKQALSPETNTMIWREQRLFPWLIWLATIYKIKYIFCTTRNLLIPKDWYFPQITKSSQDYISTSLDVISLMTFSKVGNCTFDF